MPNTNEPRYEKTGLRGFWPGVTQTWLANHWRWLGTWNFGFRKKRDCTSQVAKTKTLISFAVTAKLFCFCVFAYAKIRFSHVAASNYFMEKYVDMRIISKLSLNTSRNVRKPTMWILTRSDTNLAVQPLEMAWGLKVCI